MTQGNTTRRIFLTALGASVAFAAPVARADNFIATPVGAIWPDIDLLDANERKFQIRDASSALTLVKLWANWCPACLGEIPALKSMMAAVGPTKIEVILISHPEYWPRDQQTARSQRIPFCLATPSSSNPRAAIQAALLDQ